MPRSLPIFFAAFTSLAFAQDQSPVEPKSLPAPDQPIVATEPSVKKIDDNRYDISGIIIDQKLCEIRFPAKVNMPEGLLEFIVVHINGKLHESLLLTEISPTKLNLAFTLLRYSPSRELYALPNDRGGESNDYPDVPAATKAAARIKIEVEWKDGDALKRFPINDWVQHTTTTLAMPPGPWVYGGSEFRDGKYAPEISGDIAAVFLSGSSIINYPGADNRDDTVWIAFPKRVPPEGTDVTVIITPFSN
jgi:hypothetical protein